MAIKINPRYQVQHYDVATKIDVLDTKTGYRMSILDGTAPEAIITNNNILASGSHAQQLRDYAEFLLFVAEQMEEVRG